MVLSPLPYCSPKIPGLGDGRCGKGASHEKEKQIEPSEAVSEAHACSPARTLIHFPNCLFMQEEITKNIYFYHLLKYPFYSYSLPVFKVMFFLHSKQLHSFDVLSVSEDDLPWENCSICQTIQIPMVKGEDQ